MSDRLRLVFDTETDGLLDTVTKVHVLAVGNLDTGEITAYGPTKIGAGLRHLARAGELIGHNVLLFDLPALKRLHGWAPPVSCTITDTLVASRLILPHLDELDEQAAAMSKCSPGNIYGRHSLAAWGTRIGLPKVGDDITAWAEWTPEIEERCIGDVAITLALHKFLQPDGQSRQAMELEHRAAEICNELTATGVPFDVNGAERLCECWEARADELEAELRKQYPTVTNFGSRRQIGELLEELGLEIENRTETGQAVIDDELLESIPSLYPELKGLAEFYLIRRRLGQLANGKQAWLNNVAADGLIHGSTLAIGTPHFRAKHMQPNMAQVPNPKKGGALAGACRALFKHPGDWVFVTCDQANLQDRAVAHYLAPFDDGARVRAFIEGADLHWRTVLALGLVPEGTERDKANEIHTAVREAAKRFWYALVFGAGAKRLGKILADTVRAVRHLDPNYSIRSADGKAALDRFMAATPGLAALRESLRAQFRRCGWLPGLDGRRIPAGADYKTLNRIATAAEAVICKAWLVAVRAELGERFRYGWDGDVVLVLWVHDELVAVSRREIAQEVGEIMVRHARAAGEPYGFKAPLDAEFKIGRDWAGNTVDAGSESAAELEPEVAEADEAGEEALQPGLGVDPEAAEEEIELEAAPAGEPTAPHEPPEAEPAPSAGDARQHDHAAEVRRRMVLGGYSPLPVIGKRPALVEWQKRNGASLEEVDLWSRLYPTARNTGILTAFTPALDIDILAPEAATAIEQLVSERFGGRGKVLVRTGKAPKCLIPFQAVTPFKKIKAKLTAPDGSSGQALEFLGDGQQFVADGIHPDTHEPYHWSGGVVDEVAHELLPTISELEARQLVEDAVALLIAEHGYRRQADEKPADNGSNGAGNGAHDPTDWAAFLGDPVDHDNLAAFAMALVIAGMTDGAIVNMLRALVEGAQGDPARKQRRHEEIPAMVSSARAKTSSKAAEQTAAAIDFSTLPLTLDEWLARELPQVDPILGEMLTTTTRMIVNATTGLGKTHLGMATFGHAAAGRDFLHWRCPRPRNVLYIDGEMSRALFFERLVDLVRRLDCKPAGFFAFNREDIPDFAPLNTREGQAALWRLIEEIERRAGGALEAVCFDNVMSLIPGDMKEEDSWRETLPLILALTKRRIGQLWLHHTGHDTSRGYGTKTREWQLDVVAHLDLVERAETDLSFRLTFPKARARCPRNRDDFAPTNIQLVDDQWIGEATVARRDKKVSPLGQKFFEALRVAAGKSSIAHIGGCPTASFDEWRDECIAMGLIDKEAKPDAARSQFSKHRRELIAANWIAANDGAAWISP